jgi:release factor glutamine methyltransferase
MTTVPELITAATGRLAASAVSTPRVDAELLLAHCLGVPRSRLLTLEHVPADRLADFDAMLGRRVAREPLQHIVGTAPFRHLELAVGAGVFVPRPETELLVDAVLAGLRTRRAPVVVDLCSGSGALALAVADEIPAAQVIAVERSAAALTWLRRNVEGSGAGGAVEVVAADVTAPGVLAELRGRVDAVVCNPPYVPAATPVEPEVQADPGEAVFAGVDGLALMPAVVALAAELLRAGGGLALEHDDTQGEVVPALLARDGRWQQISAHLDLAGRPRYVTAVRR